MGIKLDWEIEAEQANVESRGEDPESARRRRAARFRLFLLVVLALVVMGGVAAGVYLRLRDVDMQIEGLLRDTVDAEVAALRIGDRTAFLSHQRSASQDWLFMQETLFNEYQNLKTSSDVQLTGRILDLFIDGTRARVHVEEIIDGIPYVEVWFYWRYEDGWRHVPPDYTLWGELATMEGNAVTVRYRAVDEAIATALGTQMDEWIVTGCAVVICDVQPRITVEVIPDPNLQIGWAVDPWTLQVPSPYTRRARLDVPISPELRLEIANLMAERMVALATNNLQPVAHADAAFLRQSAVAWLVKRFTGVDTAAYLINSLAQKYGDEAVGRLLHVLQADNDARVLAAVAGVPTLEATELDWRDYLSWRLTLEGRLIAANDEPNFLALYDTSDETARNLAYSRFASGVFDEGGLVLSAMQETDANGRPQIRAMARFGRDDTMREEEVIFRLVDGLWRRVN